MCEFLASKIQGYNYITRPLRDHLLARSTYCICVVLFSAWVVAVTKPYRFYRRLYISIPSCEMVAMDTVDSIHYKDQFLLLLITIFIVLWLSHLVTPDHENNNWKLISATKVMNYRKFAKWEEYMNYNTSRHTQAHTHARMHTHTHTNMHTHAHT